MGIRHPESDNLERYRRIMFTKVMDKVRPYHREVSGIVKVCIIITSIGLVAPLAIMFRKDHGVIKARIESTERGLLDAVDGALPPDGARSQANRDDPHDAPSSPRLHNPTPLPQYTSRGFVFLRLVTFKYHFSKEWTELFYPHRNGSSGGA